MTRWFAILAALVLAGCSAPSRWDAVGRCGSPGRHNVDASVGPRATWANGAYVEVLGGRRFRVEEPSSRGFPEEWQIFAEASIPIGGR